MTVNESPQVAESTPARTSLGTIDALTFLIMPRGYAWPISALNGSDMQRLNEIRNATRKPVTELLQDAIALLYQATAKERTAWSMLAAFTHIVKSRQRRYPNRTALDVMQFQSLLST